MHALADTSDDHASRWDGSPHHISLRIWPEDGDVAAVWIARGGHVRAWMNPQHVAAGVAWLIWTQIQREARTRPGGILYADELPAWTIPPGGMHAEECGRRWCARSK